MNSKANIHDYIEKEISRREPEVYDFIEDLREEHMRVYTDLLSCQRRAVAGAGPVQWRKFPGYPFLPCTICGGTERCSHSIPERARDFYHKVVDSGEYLPLQELIGE